MVTQISTMEQCSFPLNGKKVNVMSRVSLVACAAATTLLAAACGSTGDSDTSGSSAASAGSSDGTCSKDNAPDSMVLAVWGGPHEEVLVPGLAEFEETTGVHVEYTNDATAARITKLNAEKGSPSIDVALVPINEVPNLLENGVIMAAQEDIPGIENLKPKAKVDGGYGVSIIQIAIAYNPEKVTDPPATWLDLFDEQYEGHLAWGTIPGGNGYASLAMVARALGDDESDLIPAVNKVADAPGDIASLVNFGPAVWPLFESEDAWLYPGLSGDFNVHKAGGGNIEMYVPEDGSPALMNVATIPTGVPSLACSKALVGALLSDQVQELYAEKLYYSPATSTAVIPDSVADDVYPLDEESVVDLDWAEIAKNADATLTEWNLKMMG